MENYSDMEISVLKSCLASAYLNERRPAVVALPNADYGEEGVNAFIVYGSDGRRKTLDLFYLSQDERANYETGDYPFELFAEAIKDFDGVIEAHKIFIVLHGDRSSATISDCLLVVDMKEVQERFSCQNSR